MEWAGDGRVDLLDTLLDEVDNYNGLEGIDLSNGIYIRLYILIKKGKLTLLASALGLLSQYDHWTTPSGCFFKRLLAAV